ERIEGAHITRYTRWLQQTKGLELPDYESLWRWSVENLEEFWSSIVEFLDVRFSTPPERVLGDRTMPGAEWFPGAQVSYPEHVFKGKDDDEIAIRFASELRELDAWTWAELRSRTAAIAAALKRFGIGPGDRVAAYMPNIPETVAAFF